MESGLDWEKQLQTDNRQTVVSKNRVQEDAIEFFTGLVILPKIIAIQQLPEDYRALFDNLRVETVTL